MIYVINLEDGGGQEFFLTVKGALIPLTQVGPEQPQEFRSYKLASKKLDQLRPRYPPSCRLYGLERKEFDQRCRLLKAIITNNSYLEPPDV